MMDDSDIYSTTFDKDEIEMCLHCEKETCNGYCEKFPGGTVSRGFTGIGKRIYCPEKDEYYESIKEAAIANGIKRPTSISAVIHNRCRTANGLHFKLA